MSTQDFVFDMPKHRSSEIKVIGVGGGGSNAVNYMYKQGIEGVDFVICNTDAQALNNSPIPNKIQLGQALTEGLGAGANPEVGEQAALESIEELKKILDNNTKMVFITAGMGGGTGTGAAPVIAGLSKELGILTVGIVTAPFEFEGKMRIQQAEEGIKKLQQNVDSLIVINNNKLRELYGNLGYKAGFAKADEILTTGAKGIAEVISKHYDTNIDLKDARTVLADSGTAIMGTGRASGDNKAKDAVMAALDSPLLNNNKISGAQNVLLLIVSGSDEITMDEIGIINDHIQNEAGNNVNIIMGVGEDMDLEDKVSVTIVATGFPVEEQEAFIGKEDRVIHVLEEEQAVVRKLSAETPFPVRVKKMPEKKSEESKTATDEVKFFLDEESKEDEMIENEILNQDVPTIIEKETTQTPEILSETITPAAEEAETPKENKEEPVEEFSQTVMFSIDDEIEFEIHENTEADTKTIEPAKAQTVAELPIETTEDEAPDPFDAPIPESLSKAIEERRMRLKQFNYKFKNTLSKKSVDEVESVPAYKRLGVELSERTENSPSDFMLSKDSKDELKIRPNNFLHDNVD